MKVWHFLMAAIGIALVGILVTYLLFPSDRQLALLLKKDKYFAQSLEVYEKLYKNGDRSPGVMTSLVELYLQNGKVDEAVKFLEEYVELNPNDIAALKKMGVLYQYAQRPDDYLNNLEKLYILSPDTETLRELSRVYNYYGMKDKQAKVLEKLLADPKHNEDDVVDLAYLYLDNKEQEKVDAIFAKYMQHPENLKNPRNVDFFLSYLLDKNEDEKAITFAKSYIKAHPKLSTIVRIAERLNFRGRELAAYELIQPYSKYFQKNIDLLALNSTLKVALKMEDVAYDDLKKLYDKKRLPRQLVRLFMELSLEQRSATEIVDIIAETNISTMPDDSIVKIIEKALASKYRQNLIAIKKRLGPEFLLAHPIIATVLDIALDGKKRPVQLKAFRSDESLNTSMKLRLASFYLQANLKDEALLMARQLDEQEDYRYLPISEMVTLFLRLGEEKRGLQIFETMYANPDLAKLNYVKDARVLFSIATDHPQVAEEAINEKSSRSLLADIAHFAIIKKQAKLALKAATQLYNTVISRSSAALLIDAYILNEQYEAALVLLRPLIDDDPKLAEVYVKALNAAVKTNKAGDSKKYADELRAYMEAHPGSTAIKDPLSIAYGLLDTGDKAGAFKIFEQLAENQSAQSEAVKRLIYVWGPRPAQEKIDWTWKRALSSSGKEQEKWFQNLFYQGQEKKFMSLYENKKLPQSNAVIDDLYVDLLIKNRDYKKLDSAVMKIIEGSSNQKRLSALVTKIRDIGRNDLLLKILRRQLALSPDRQTLSELSINALFISDAIIAKQAMQKFFASGGEDFLLRYYFGTILLSDGEEERANRQFRLAQKVYLAKPSKSMDEEIIYADLLSKLGNNDDAKARYAWLIKKYPKNKRIKVAYSHILMNDNLFEEAEDVLHRKRK